MALSAKVVDPRDVGWEDMHPVYRVYFTAATGATEEWRVSDATSVEDVLEWAERQGRARSHTIYLEVDATVGAKGLIRLAEKKGEG